MYGSIYSVLLFKDKIGTLLYLHQTSFLYIPLPTDFQDGKNVANFFLDPFIIQVKPDLLPGLNISIHCC